MTKSTRQEITFRMFDAFLIGVPYCGFPNTGGLFDKLAQAAVFQPFKSVSAPPYAMQTSRLRGLSAVFLRLAFILTAVFLALPSVLAQTSNASITGIVTDPTGAVVSGAKVEVTDVERNVNFHTETNQTGLYLVSELIPAAYRIKVEAAGFRMFVVDSLQLSTRQRATVNVKLEIGAISEKVEVTGEVQLLEASNATLGGVVENKKVVDLPLNNRNIFTLMTLVPGVTPSTPNSQSDFFTSSIRYSINGGLESTTDIQVDGLSAVAQSDIPGMYGASALPSVDSIQEFRVQTNAYSAEFGRSGGGLITMVTKSGTNKFHGGLFEFLRNNAMDANDFFANKNGNALPPLQQSQFGASLGGAVIKNRTFFFLVYEGKRMNNGSFNQYSVPTQLQRQGDFSQTYNSAGQLRVIYNPFSVHADPSKPTVKVRDPFPSNLIPNNLMDPVAVKAMSYYPQPNQPGLPFTNQRNLGLTAHTLFPTDRVDFKVDHNFNPNQRFFVRYNYFSSELGDLNFWNNVATPATGTMSWGSHNGEIDYTQTIGANTVLDVRAGANRFNAFRPSYSYGFDLTSLGLPTSLMNYVGQGNAYTFPTFGIQDYSQLGPNSGSYYSSANTNYSLVGSLSRVIGRHTLKVGTDFRIYFLNFAQYGAGFTEAFSRTMTQGPAPLTPSAAAGDGFASFLLGTGDSGSSTYTMTPANSNRYFATYFQDDFKLTPRLTINAGLRLEAETATKERYDRLTEIDPFVLNPLSNQVGFSVYGGYLFAGGSLGSRSVRPTEYKLNPRFGIAYQLNPKTVIRTGYGIFYGVTYAGAAGNNFIGPPFLSTTTMLPTLDSGVTVNDVLRNPFSSGYVYPLGAGPGLLSSVGQNLASGWSQTLKSPYNQQWNFTIQRSLAQNMMVQVAYAGNKGTHLGTNLGRNMPNMNQLRPELINAQSDLLTMVANPFYGLIPAGATSKKNVQRGQLLRPLPAWNNVVPRAAGWGNSEYQSLQIMLEKRFGSSTSLIASHTWSKTMSDVADGYWNDATLLATGPIRNWYCLRCEHAVSTYDLPQHFVLSFTYELPFGKGKMVGSNWSGVTNVLLGGWQANGILTMASGQPLVITLAQNTSNSFGGGQHVDATGIDAGSLSSQGLDGWFNKAAFAQPAAYSFGNLGRTVTSVRTDWTRNMDFSMFKKFNLTERIVLEFRAESFNFTNTPVFNGPNTVFGSGSFATIGGQSNTPRQMQLALKLLF